MKKNLFYVGALILGLTLGTSCSEEDGLVKNNQTLVEATINNPASRTTVSSDYKVVWSQGDAYTVWSSDGTKKGDLTLATGEGSTTGSFTGTLSIALDNGDVALFPSVSDESKSYTFNSEYTNTETDAPMLGTYNGTSFSFNHLAAFIRVNANNLPAGNAVLTITSENQALTGKATLTDGNALIPSGDGKTITVAFTAVAGQNLVFDAPIPAQVYDKITLTLEVDETEIFQKERALNAVVGNLYELTSTKMTVEEANTVLEGLKDNKSMNVNISGLTSNATIAVPIVEGSVLNMDISDVSSESSITIKNNEGASVGESQQNIGVNVANNASTAIGMTINTPTATVEVGKGYFTTVTATTATNTLIVGEDVTITNLVVAAGNVRIEEGGKVTNITRSEKNNAEKTYVIFEGTLPTEPNSDPNIAYISAAEWDLRKAIEDGGTVTLDADIDLTSSLEVSSDLVVNLNGKSIKCASSDVFVVTAGTLTINGDGTVYGSEDNSSSSCAVWAKGNGTVIINGGTYKVGHDGASKTAGSANWRNDCIYARDNAKITINGGEFAYTGDINTENFQSDGNRFLLNCRDADYKDGKCSITVKGGTFHNFNPGATSSENPVASYVAAGYSSVAGENDTFVVKKAN